MWSTHPTFGGAICVVAVGVVLSQLGLVFFYLMRFTRNSLQDDLKDIREHYKLTYNAGADLEPSGPRAFWVVEATHKISGETELAGCVGLGTF